MQALIIIHALLFWNCAAYPKAHSAKEVISSKAVLEERCISPHYNPLDIHIRMPDFPPCTPIPIINPPAATNVDP